jgi:hypothetical protein
MGDMKPRCEMERMNTLLVRFKIVSVSDKIPACRDTFLMMEYDVWKSVTYFHLDIVQCDFGIQAHSKRCS